MADARRPRAEQLPRGRHRLSREDVLRSQRERTLRGMVEVVAERGYAASTITQVVDRAGVSSATFYQLFSDKEDCFLAAYDMGATATYEAMVKASEGIKDWRELLDAVFTTWLEFLAADLAFTRAYMVEFWAAGDAARERWKARRDRTAGLLKTLHKRARKEDPTIEPVSDTVIAAVVGGVNRVVISHVLANDPRPLTALKPELLRFITLALASHEPPAN